MFRRAKPAIDQAAVEQSRWGNLQVTGVEASADLSRSKPRSPHITVRLERRRILEVTVSGQELIEDFVRRLRS